ncbi:MAG: DUF962 domain-containing protein [Cytophagales bacterium]|nr:DUF962 domain-containing protein [Cytophagales bacterium]
MTECRVDSLLAHYGSSHTHPTNELIHMIAIPLIALSLSGLLYAIHPYLLYAFLIGSFIYYARLSAVFLITMLAWSAVMLWIVQALGAQLVAVCTAVFVGAWILQLIGHKIEGKKPSFFEDIQYLWVGPLFVLSKLFIKIGIKW